MIFAGKKKCVLGGFMSLYVPSSLCVPCTRFTRQIFHKVNLFSLSKVKRPRRSPKFSSMQVQQGKKEEPESVGHCVSWLSRLILSLLH